MGDDYLDKIVKGTLEIRIPRGIRNNNPGNLKEMPEDKTQWFGERATNDDPIFEEFEEPEHGIRALCKVLLTYYRKHKLGTVSKIITRWAPGEENDTGAYIISVCRQMRVSTNAPLKVDEKATLQALAAAIIVHENGRRADGLAWYDDATLAYGVSLALED